MNKKMKYLKKFDQEKVYEEISFRDAALIMTQLVQLGAPQAGTLTLSQALQQQTQGTQLSIDIGVSRTTEVNVCYNNPTYVTQEVQDNLPPTSEAGKPTYTIKFKESELLKAIQEGREVFFYSKYISDAEAKAAGAKYTQAGNLQTTNFLKVGKQVVNGKGTVTLDLTDGTDEEIIASGNGLLLLMRLAANNQRNLEQGKGFLKLNVMNMGEAKAGKDKVFKDADVVRIMTNSDKVDPARTLIYFLFTVSDPMHNQKIKEPLSNPSDIRKYQSGHGRGYFGVKDGKIVDHKLRGLGDIINKVPEKDGVIPQERDEMVTDLLTMQLLLMNDFVYSTQQLVEQPAGIKYMSREEIKGYLDRFHSATDEKDKDKVFLEFMQRAMDDYKTNFLNFIDSYTKDLKISKETILQEFNIEDRCNDVINALRSRLGSEGYWVDSKGAKWVEGKSTGERKFKEGEKSKQFKTISQIEGTINKAPRDVPPPIKKIEVSKTDVVEGTTTYVIKNKYNAKVDVQDLHKLSQPKDDPFLKKEGFKFLKTFERFKY